MNEKVRDSEGHLLYIQLYLIVCHMIIHDYKALTFNFYKYDNLNCIYDTKITITLNYLQKN